MSPFEKKTKKNKEMLITSEALEMLGVAKGIDSITYKVLNYYINSSPVIKAIDTGHFRVPPDYNNLFTPNFKK